MTPTLETERLLLRPFGAEDAGAVAALADNWEVARMLSRMPHPYTREMAEEWIASHDGLRESGEEHVFCIEMDGEVAGSVGFQRTREGIYELGYWLGESWWGRGIASEAAARIVRFAFEELGADRLVSGHLTENAASGRVLQKCGFRYTHDSMQPSKALGRDVEHKDFELTRAGWASRTDGR